MGISSWVNMLFLKRYNRFTLIQRPIHIWVPPLVYRSTTGALDTTLASKASGMDSIPLASKASKWACLESKRCGIDSRLWYWFFVVSLHPCIMWSQTVNFDFFTNEQITSVALRWILLKTGEIRWCATVSITCVHVCLSVPSQRGESTTPINASE